MRALIVHHTDTANSYSAAQAYAQVRAVYAFHPKVRGWNDIGYNFLVDRFGRVFEGRARQHHQGRSWAPTPAASTPTARRRGARHFTTQVPSRAAVDALAGLLAWKAAQYGIDPAPRSPSHRPAARSRAIPREPRCVGGVSAHRDVGNTECPGDALYGQLPRLRREVATRLAPGLVGPGSASVRRVVGHPRRPRRGRPHHADLDPDGDARLRRLARAGAP